MHPCYVHMTAEARKRPIERASNPRYSVLLAGERGTTPLVAAVQKPDAGKIKLACYGLDLVRIRRVRLQQPASRHGVDRGQQPGRDARQPANALVPQRPRAYAAFGGVPKGPTVPHIDNWNGRKSRGQYRAHS